MDLAVIETFAGLFLFAGDMVEELEDPDRTAERIELMRAIAAPELEVRMVGPGLTGTFHGVESFEAAWRDWLEPFASYRIEPDEEVRMTDEAAVFFGRQVAIPKGGAGRMEGDAATVAFFNDDGRLSRLEFHLDRASALRAAGLED